MITPGQLDQILEMWRREYGYGGAGIRAYSDDHGGGCGGGPAPVGRTVADDFNAAWVRLSDGTPREYRMAMCLRGDVMAHPSDPMTVILDRLQRWGIRMDVIEFGVHVGWARAHFCALLNARQAA